MIKEVITYPNKLLRLKSKDVEQFDTELHSLLDDMYDTMMAQGGVGLAAIQITVPLNVLIINLQRLFVILNSSEFMKNGKIIQVADKEYITRCIMGYKWIQFIEVLPGKDEVTYVPIGNPQQIFQKHIWYAGDMTMLPISCDK